MTNADVIAKLIELRERTERLTQSLEEDRLDIGEMGQRLARLRQSLPSRSNVIPFPYEKT